MKKLVTILLNISLLASCLLFSAETAYSQKKGSFDEELDHKGEKRLVSFLVPSGYSDKKKWPVIIGFHPYQTPQTAMREMLTSAATELNAILVCPNDDPDYDGTIITTITEYLLENYNIDYTNIVLTGYSAGGGGTFGYGLPHYQNFKGLIGIATCPSSSPSSVQAALKSLPIGFVVGIADELGYYDRIQTWISQAEPFGAKIKLIAKAGVGHYSGEYFYSANFTADWITLYNFIQTTVFPPGATVLKTPDNGVTDVKAPVKFIWNKNAKAKNYEFQIAETEDFTPLTETKTVTDTFYTVKTLKNNGTFYWRVRAKNDGGNGDWSSMRSIETEKTIPTEVPGIVSPDNEAGNLAVPVLFEWDVVDLATKYQIQIFEENLPAAVVDDKNIPAPQGDKAQYTASTLRKGKNFTWKVRGASADGDGPWSELRSFSTMPDLPTEKPNALYPPDNMVKAATDITFEWSLITGAVTYGFQAREEAGQEPAFNFTDIPTMTGKMTYEVKGFKPSTKYFWQVRGSNAAGNSPWSNEFSFTTDNFVSVEDGLSREYNIRISPNPASEYFTMYYTLGTAARVDIGIYNLAGLRVMNLAGSEKQPGNYNAVIETAGLPAGLYLARITIDNNTYNYKLIIK